MLLLGLDIGSSTVKCALLRDSRFAGKIIRVAYSTHFSADRAEGNPRDVEKAIASAIAQLPKHRPDAIALDVMGPSWLATDKKGKALTPFITHQDRRSIAQAREIEKRVGKSRHLHLAGNRPFPGGIAPTTWLWFKQNAASLVKRFDLVGHLNTYLLRRLTGRRLTDPSHASFMGVYSTLTLAGWNDELCKAVQISKSLLPEVQDSNVIAGLITASAAREFGLQQGTPIFTGLMDTSAAAMVAGINPGQLLNISGTTDVLALMTDKPVPHENLLTRALGIGRSWMSIDTLAAAGAALTWARQNFFAELSIAQFNQLLNRLGKKPAVSGVRFEPYLAGSRTSIEQRQAAFTGLTLSTGREELLSAIIEALAEASAQRLALIRKVNRVDIKRDVLISGGMQGGLHHLLHRDWPGRWKFTAVDEATLRGLSVIIG